MTELDKINAQIKTLLTRVKNIENEMYNLRRISDNNSREINKIKNEMSHLKKRIKAENSSIIAKINQIVSSRNR